MANSSSFEDQFLSAVKEDDYETVRRFLDRRRVNVKQKGSYYLCEAAECNAVQVIQLLVDRGVNVRSKWDGRTPLHGAAGYGNTQTVELLVDKGADIHCVNPNGVTPLHDAAGEGNTQTVELLVDKGADINCVIKGGRTPLYVAVVEGHTQTVELLVDKGAHINVGDMDGWTPLHAAVVWGDTQTVELLLDKGADINRVDKGGNTPFDYCGNDEVRKLLQKYQASQLEKKKKEEVGHQAGASIAQFMMASGTPAPVGPSRLLVDYEGKQGNKPPLVKSVGVLSDATTELEKEFDKLKRGKHAEDSTSLLCRLESGEVNQRAPIS